MKEVYLINLGFNFLVCLDGSRKSFKCLKVATDLMSKGVDKLYVANVKTK